MIQSGILIAQWLQEVERLIISSSTDMQRIVIIHSKLQNL